MLYGQLSEIVTNLVITISFALANNILIMLTIALVITILITMIAK